MMEQLQHFHFLRPLWLLALLPLLGLWWSARPRDVHAPQVPNGIAPHLAAALTVGTGKRRRIYPIDAVALCGVLLALATAGPTWSRIPNPLVADTAPLVVAVEVTPSMKDTDLPPSRAERARFKVLDLIAARAGARTALVAFAGSAHRVAPLTEDPGILRPLLESLAPEVMPAEGEDVGAAMDLAAQILTDAKTPGAVLFVLDDLSPSGVEALAIDRTPAVPIMILVAAPPEVALPQLDRLPDATVVRMTPDDSDIRSIERQLRAVQAAALAGDDRLQWNDRAWWLAWPAALLTLLWFRRGWTMRWGVLLIVFGGAQVPGVAYADGWRDWFLTPDQQGQRAFRQNEFARAGDLFEDPMWQGHAKYRAGAYAEAVEIFAGLDSADAAFAMGMAQIKSREYRPAIASFELALERQPDFPEAARNLEIAKAILDYVETAREQSDTGEERGIGADDVVFDNEANRGADTTIDAPQDGSDLPLSADQWMQSIDTQMGDFLRSRFLLDNAEQPE